MSRSSMCHRICALAGRSAVVGMLPLATVAVEAMGADFNGDGFADLVVGLPFTMRSGNAGFRRIPAKQLAKTVGVGYRDER